MADLKDKTQYYRMTYSTLQKTENIVDGLLFERGYYEPLLLLQQKGNLDYHHYKAWRNGEKGCLDLVLSGDLADIIKSLDVAASYALELGLEAIEYSYTGWRDVSEKPLCLSENKELQQYLQTHYQLPQERWQMDIFMDSPATRISNTLIKSLATHNPVEAARQLKQLQELDPDHGQLEAFTSLLAALELADKPVTANIRDELNWLEQNIVPLAEDILKRDALDFLIPHWWRLSQALQDTPFNQDTPKLHCSYMNTYAYDWNGVRNSVEWEKDWYKQPVLLIRHAKACYMLNDEFEAYIDLFRVFWHYPHEAGAIFETNNFPQLKLEWIKFQDNKKDLADTAFPAWFLIRHPGVINHLPREIEKEEGEGYLEYQLVYALLKSDQEKNEEENMQLRKNLQIVNQGLLKCYFQYRR